MSDTPQGPDWWLASDGRYYPPQPPAPPPAPTAPPSFGQPPTATQPPAPGESWAPPSPEQSWPLPAPGAPAPGVPTPSSGGGTRVALVVVGLVVVVGILGALGLAAVLAVRGATSDAQSVDVASPTTVEQLVPDDPTGGTASPPTGDAQVVATEVGFSMGEGFDGEQAANAGAVIENNGSTTAAFFEVIFTFTDDAGATVGTETSYVYAVDPGGTVHASVDAVSLQGPATTVDAAVVLDEDPSFWTGTVVPVEVSGVAVDEFFGLQVNGTASNPTGAPIQAATVQCVIRENGKIVGGASAVLDTIVPGGEVSWEAITFSDWLRGDSAECSGGTYD